MVGNETILKKGGFDFATANIGVFFKITAILSEFFYKYC